MDASRLEICLGRLASLILYEFHRVIEFVRVSTATRFSFISLTEDFISTGMAEDMHKSNVSCSKLG